MALMPWWHAAFGVLLVATGAFGAIELLGSWRLPCLLGLYAALAALYVSDTRISSIGRTSAAGLFTFAAPLQYSRAIQFYFSRHGLLDVRADTPVLHAPAAPPRLCGGHRDDVGPGRREPVLSAG